MAKFDAHLKCSFCGKSQDQVRKLIAGPGVYICDECIDLCNEILDEELIDTQTKLNNLGYNLEFIDVRKNPIGLDQIKQLIARFGNQILNKRSTTFRGLPQSEKDFSAVQLLQKYPTLMKRPVVMSSEKNSIGWNAEIIKEWSF